MTYQETLTYLYSQLPMFQKLGGIAMKEELHNIKVLDERLGHPHQSYPCIHIAGTNGKGSTANMLSAILQAAGLKVGLITSPHYVDFRERFKVNGALAPEQYVIDFVAKTKEWYHEIQPSFFEMAIAMSFEYFKQEHVDIAVVETGLGGLKDSTNIINPILSIITNIGLDHQEYLGETLPEIAMQKAGIIKHGIPVVIGETNQETTAVFQTTAQRKQSDIHFADQLYKVKQLQFDGHYSYYNISKNEELIHENIACGLHGQYQQQNIQTVFQAIDLLNQGFDPPIQKEQVLEGLKNIKSYTNMRGRWDILQQHPLIIADSGHNIPGVEATMQQLSKMDAKQLHIVWGMVTGKDHAPILKRLPKKATYYFCQPNVPRKLDATALSKMAEQENLHGSVYTSVGEALEAAKKVAESDDLIFVGGSTFVVAEVV